MEYVKGVPYFCDKVKKIKQYPYLSQDKYCDILIIGGGIDGSIANFYLADKFDVILVDKDRLGFGCTSCATALLEYQLDDFASDLMKYMSEQEICMAYRMGLDAIDKIKDFINKYGNSCDFYQKPTFLYSNSIFSKKAIVKEYKFRIKHNFACELFDETNNPFPFAIKSGIFAQNGGCEFNPYLFEKIMIENAKNQEDIFENTKISKIEKSHMGFVAKTNFGEKIYCKKILISTGFNWEVLKTQDLCERFITYSVVTSSLKDFSWYENALIHDAVSPYHYLRMLPGNKIIFGGEDTVYKGKDIDEKLANKKYDKLANDLCKLFPNRKDIKIDYKFCGCFGTTPNNLGLIGESKFDDDILLFISCGANGIINAMKGIEVIEDILQHKDNKLIKIFSPKRD